MRGGQDVGRTAAVAVVAVAIVAGSAGGVVAARYHASRAAAPRLPEFHGQQTWRAGERPAPAIALRDQDGRLVRLAGLRGSPVLVTFLDSRCTSDCPIEARQLGRVLRGLPAKERPTLVVVSVDPKGDTPASIAAATRKWRLDGPWRLHWLRGTPTQLRAVWEAYGIEVSPKSNDIVHGLALYLVDRAGNERTGYLFPFLPGFLTTDLERLAA